MQRASSALTSCCVTILCQVEQLEDPVAAAAEVVRRCEARQLMALYKVPAFENPEALMQQIANARGKLRKGGLPDVEVGIV